MPHVRRHASVASLAAFAALLAPPARATQEPATCDKIPLGDQRACAAEVKEKCEPISDNYSDMRRLKCEDAAVRKYNRCLSADYLAACRPAKKAASEVCSGATDFNGSDPASMAAWVDRVKRWEDANRRIHEYWKEFAA